MTLLADVFSLLLLLILLVPVFVPQLSVVLFNYKFLAKVIQVCREFAQIQILTEHLSVHRCNFTKLYLCDQM